MAIGRVPGATGIQPSIVDAKGDLIAATAADSVSRLAVGTNNQVLTADSAEATGLKYANEARATLTTTGDLLYASAANTPARLGIGSTDQVLKVSGGIPAWGATPSAAFVGCSLYNSGAQSLANATATAITFDSEHFDTDGFHSTSTNTSRITIPTGKGGYYLFLAFAEWPNNTTGRRFLYLRKNGSTIVEFESNVNINVATVTAELFYVTSTAVGDYFEIFGDQTSGGNLNVYFQNTVGAFQAQYLGA